MKYIYLIAISMFFTGALVAQVQRRNKCPQPWVFFDLGNTIVDTKTFSFNPMFHMTDVSQKDSHNQFIWKDGKDFASSRDYVEALIKNSTTLGMIIDIPERWNVPYPVENPVQDEEARRVVRLNDFLAGKVAEDNASWKEGEPNWDYSPFGNFTGQDELRKWDGRLVLPKEDKERKDSGNPVLFEKAIGLATAAGCKAIYQGEDAGEMQLAENSGMYPFRVGVTSSKYFYLPPSKFQWYVDNYRPGLWQGLGDDDFK